MNGKVRTASISVVGFIVAATGVFVATSFRTPPPAEAQVAVITQAPSAASASSVPSPSASAPGSADFEIVVGEDVAPAIAEVEGLEDGDPDRPVGRMTGAEGTTDFVRDELIVSTRSDAELEALLDRWNGELLDSFPVIEGITDHLVRVDLSTADTTRVAADLASFEAHEDLEVSDDSTLRLIAIMAAETAGHGTAVALNPIEVAAGVPEGEAQESSDQDNPFTWPYLRGGGVQDFAVGPAWQLLEAHGRLERSVRILINDGGFTSTADFPDDVTLRKADWGQQNALGCSGGNPCPYHGTDVTMTLVGQLDNEYGTVGPAGPVVDELILVAIQKDTWKRLRTLEDMVAQYRPDVVNMSYGTTVTAARAASRAAYDRRYKHMRDMGALLVAAAGNEGYDLDQEKCVFNNCFESREVFPCESSYVLCVGGVATNSIQRASGSNYGWKDNRESVEIWGPMRVITINDTNKTYLDFTTKWTGGTSFSSPFVAGIAALVKAADPSLSPEEIRDILNDTANVGVQDQWITGSQRRVDALAAVARALGVDLDGPAVTITNPDHGEDYSQSNWLQLKGSAIDYRGVALPIRWVSSIDGQLANKVGTVSLGELSLGTHVLTATAVDAIGQVGKAEITFDVVRRPVEVSVSSPADNTIIEEGDQLSLSAGTSDPENYWQALPDGNVRWEIRRANGTTVIWSRSGHDAIVEGSALEPGSYVATFEATAYGNTVEESRQFTVEALPPGHTKPNVTISKPTAGKVYNTGGAPVQVQLKGSAVDNEDGALSGTRFQWIATAGDTTVVLCQGSAFKAPAGNGPAIAPAPKDCSNVTVPLGVSPLAPNDPTWTITLRVRDFANDIGTDVVKVDVQVHVG
jgi:serine protease